MSTPILNIKDIKTTKAMNDVVVVADIRNMALVVEWLLANSVTGLPQNVIDALNAASSPSAVNPFVTVTGLGVVEAGDFVELNTTSALKTTTGQGSVYIQLVNKTS